jgi:hypothetical protein
MNKLYCSLLIVISILVVIIICGDESNVKKIDTLRNRIKMDAI